MVSFGNRLFAVSLLLERELSSELDSKSVRDLRQGVICGPELRRSPKVIQ
jgi:hypothetical protein